MKYILTCEYMFLFIFFEKFLSCECLSELHPELTVEFFMEKLQVHRCVVIMSVYSTCHGLHLAAVHAQGKWVNHFQHALELREGVGLLVVEWGPLK